MSRSQYSSASSRYKISAPQPYVGHESRADGGDPEETGHRSPLPSATQHNSANDVNTASSSSHRQSSQQSNGQSGSPVRPARSRMRDHSGPTAASQSSRRNPGANQTDAARRTPAQSSASAYQNPISPVSPGLAIGGPPLEETAEITFNDPFAADRSQRSELRAQASAAVQQSAMLHAAPSGGRGTDKLRNVVGAFMTASRGKEDPTAKRPAKSRARVTQKDDYWDISEGGRFSAIDEVLRKIRKDWPFVLDSDFSPSTLALSLLSQATPNSLPPHPPLSSFLKLHDALSNALQSSVQAHFQSFAASLPAHASFLATLGRAQQQIRASKEALNDARDSFAGKGKAELAGIKARERMVRDMLELLDTIDQLKQVPDLLEALIGDKKFLQASLLLIRSIKTISKAEIAQIGAVSDLRAYLESQETTLSDILVEELHNHLYLKTFNSDSRWRAHVPGQASLPVFTSESEEQLHTTRAKDNLEIDDDAGNAIAGPEPSSRLSRYLSALVTKPHEGPVYEEMEEIIRSSNALDSRQSGGPNIGQAQSSLSLTSLAGPTRNNLGKDGASPESDSYRYIELLLESLATLGRLGHALDTITQRATSEIHNLVEATLDEVEERAEQLSDQKALETGIFAEQSTLSHALMTASSTQLTLTTEMNGLSSELVETLTGSTRHTAVLNDLFWTVYSKLAAVLEGHRVVYEVSRWISTRRDFKDTHAKDNASLSIPVLEIWRPVQQEVRNLLHSYLNDESQGSSLDRHPLMPINEVLRDNKMARDRQRPMFRFSDTDMRSVSNEIKSTDDSVHETLKSTVPGLVNMTIDTAGQSSIAESLAPDENLSMSGRHRNLVPPNAFNVTTLFQPTLAFIESSAAVAPSGFEEEPKAFSIVLEEFVVKVFLPQLDERVTAAFQYAVSGHDAYQVDRQLTVSNGGPTLKSSARVMKLIYSLCVMLQTTPFHRENYSRLIVGVIVQYYQQCSARFKELVSLPDSSNVIQTAESPMALPAIWAQREDIAQCLTGVRATMVQDRETSLVSAHHEVKLEMDLLKYETVIESQLINSSRRLEALGHLSHSLRWFIHSLIHLQDIAEEPVTLEVADPRPNDEKRPRLPLTRAMAQRYEAIVQTYEQLAEMITNTLRLEIRCRCVCNLGASLRKGDFRLESQALEPDPDIVDLARHLTDSESLLNVAMSPTDLRFVLCGLPHLVDHMFIHASRFITLINEAGVQKIRRNILALQQTLRAMGPATEEEILDRSMQYWDMYERGPKAMLEGLRSGKPLFSFDDYNTMLNLQCKSDQSEAPSSKLNTYLIDLHALSMSIEGWEIGGT